MIRYINRTIKPVIIPIEMMKDLNIMHMYIIMKNQQTIIYLQLINLVKTKYLLNKEKNIKKYFL